MGFILWPAALLLFLLWSLAAWLVFGVSDWAAGQAATALGGVLTAELGPWAAWVIGSLGTLIKFGVIAVWALVGLGILGAPVWLRRKRQAGQIPDDYRRGYRPDDGRFSHRPEADHEGWSRDRGGHEGSWRDRKEWQDRAHQSRGELSFLRDAVGEAMGKYRRKKWKKRDKDDDDD